MMASQADDSNASMATKTGIEDLTARSSMELSDAAQRAFAFRLKESDGKGILDPHNPRPAPVACSIINFQTVYDRPAGFISIPLDFLPMKSSEVAIRACAHRYAEEGNNPGKVAEMEALIKAILDELDVTISSKVKLEEKQICRASGIKHDGKQIESYKDLFKYWTNSNPDERIIENTHNCLYGEWKKAGRIESIVYECCASFKGWPAIPREKKKGKKPPACPIKTHIMEEIRGRRTRFSKVKDSVHGLTLSISVAAENNMGRPAKDMFDIRRCVKGWKSAKHVEYLQTNGLTAPVIPKLDGAALLPIMRKKKGGSDTNNSELTAKEASKPAAKQQNVV